MKTPSFKQFLCLSEDAAAELSALTMQRQQLILKKNNLTKQIDQQIAALDKTIYQKEKQSANLQQQQQQQQQQQSGAQQQMARNTPGSTGAPTPGSGVPNNPAQQGSM